MGLHLTSQPNGVPLLINCLADARGRFDWTHWVIFSRVVIEFVLFVTASVHHKMVGQFRSQHLLFGHYNSWSGHQMLASVECEVEDINARCRNYFLEIVSSRVMTMWCLEWLLMQRWDVLKKHSLTVPASARSLYFLQCGIQAHEASFLTLVFTAISSHCLCRVLRASRPSVLPIPPYLLLWGLLWCIEEQCSLISPMLCIFQWVWVRINSVTCQNPLQQQGNFPFKRCRVVLRRME